MEMINPNDIKTHETFEKLFPIKDELLEKIATDMREQGYDTSQAIILAQWDGLKEPVCIDGHTRLKAALEAGIEQVPVWFHELDSEDEAMDKAIRLQCHRRNLTDAELVKFVKLLDKRGSQGRDASTGRFTGAQGCATGKSANATAEILHTSARKVEQARTIIDHGDPEVVEAVEKGTMSVNKGYQETQKKRKRAQSEGTQGKRAATNDVPPVAVAGEEALAAERSSEQTPRKTPVALSPEQYDALSELEGPVELHVARAVDLYLKMIEQEGEEPGWLSVPGEYPAEDAFAATA